jgi:large subunit ribosomal protein L13
MKTYFSKSSHHTLKYFILDAKEQILGRFCTIISNLVTGKITSYYTPGINLGNIVIINNSNLIKITGKKNKYKFYYKITNRPGNLNYKTFNEIKNRLPHRILLKSIFGMLPKNILGRRCFKKIYVYIKTPFKYDTK